MPLLRRRERRQGSLLPELRDATGRGGSACGRRPQGRHDRLRRRDRVDGARRAARPRGAPPRDGPVLRRDGRGDRAPRRHGREVHRRRGDGGLRHPATPRGRRGPRRARGGRDARGARGAQPRARARPRCRDRGSDRRQHRRGGRRRPVGRPATRHRRRGERRRPAGAGRRAGRDPPRRVRPTGWSRTPSRSSRSPPSS